jgi:hypothetical protein
MAVTVPDEDQGFLLALDGKPDNLLKRASALKSRPIKWGWKGWMPLGAITVWSGVEGVGKSTFAAWLIAQVTRGRLKGDWHGDPMDVLIVAGEDALEDAWMPRLEVAGADLDRVHFLDLDALPVDWNIRDGIGALHRTVEATGAKLVVIDALLDHMPAGFGGENINNPMFVRSALGPLRDFARKLGIVALISLHPPKSRGGTFRECVQASPAFVALSRSGLFIAYHPEDEDLDDDQKRRVVIRGRATASAILAPRVPDRR